MKKGISRRSVLLSSGGIVAGATLGIPTTSFSRQVGHKAGRAALQDPPQRVGLRGSHAGSFETAHKVAWQGWRDWGPVIDTDEGVFDLVVVGSGVSGLSAAYFHLRDNPGARILIIENHDDFGGHAKRNEVMVEGRMVLGHGGSQSLQDPSTYSSAALQMLREIGVSLPEMRAAFDDKFFEKNSLGSGIFFDKNSYGVDRLVKADLPFTQQYFDTKELKSMMDASSDFPIAKEARSQLQRLLSDSDALHRVEESELESLSYNKFLDARLGGAHPDLKMLFEKALVAVTTATNDFVPASEALAFGLPGHGVPRSTVLSEEYKYHFPDGNATVARLLVAKLCPWALKARDMHECLVNRVDYAKLDGANSERKVRLNSTAVDIRHDGAVNSAERVFITYVRNGRAERVVSRNCILACYNNIIPHIWNELPIEQSKDLSKCVRAPLVYANVFVKNWRPWAKAGIAYIYFPGERFSLCGLDFPVSYRTYRYPETPDQPVALHMQWVPTAADAGELPDQYRAARHILLSTSYETMEASIRSQLARSLGPYGFVDQDIAEIVINRHSHGYAASRDLYGEVSHGGSSFVERGRKRLGRVSIANSDSGGIALLDNAIDQGYRASREILS
jgi:spermidine dehydrogenase